ncbi:M13 family metallopeptidase [Chryseobacterium sp. Ch-15]|uniref:M13 family metallopeptidase n=1 Tax=Chryseobacterium muglaense TaxID=2893752 RepID=A0A9Q3YSL7_9FLAO|nr:M13 family metallopeptidase [Chryseobacterium muglaense]MBD3903327.1 M13 family metallopeptidase [Chryseobacterium muglaense]MCC9036156.1 M13 family metallopeptidase [Chryseobacterium muglaense]MCM2553269.1 M13 family metallopeptidase [Chryseobacterium muglaense]
MNQPISIPNASILFHKINLVFIEISKIRVAILLFALIFGVFHIKGQENEFNKGKATSGNWGVQTQFISNTVKPGQDFYTYVNEGWLKSVKIPPGSSGFNSFSEAKDKINLRINEMIRDGDKTGHSPNQSLKQISSVYLGYLDTDHMDKLGIRPIENDLENILAIRSYEEVAKWMADPKSFSIIAIHTGPDLKDRSKFLVSLNESGIGLPAPEYYTKDDAANIKHRKAYREYIIRTLNLAGIKNADRRADDILNIETKLAALQWTPAQMRDSKINSHVINTVDLNTYAPGFPWKVFLKERQVENVDQVILQADTAMKAKAKLFAETPTDVWSSYLAFHWIVNHSTILSKDFRQNHFNFYGTQLSGIQADVPREQKSIQYVNSRLGQLVGKLYVEKYFPESHLKSMEDLVGYIRRAFLERLEKLDWLDDQSRKEAIDKLNAVTVRIGYPEIWRDYSSLKFDSKNPIANEQMIAKINWDHERSLLDKKFTSKEWYQMPQTVDATSSKLYNSIEFPAGILQPIFFDPYADKAVNFGAIGAIIGHELGHCFDDQGSQFDGNGVMRDWWTPETRKQFEGRTQLLIEQYNSYSPLDGIHLNGKQTLGENIGDLTGVVVAHAAYQLYLKDHPDEKKNLDGFTPDQRYFLSFAQANRSLYTPEAYRLSAEKDYHAPALYRVNGVVRNIDAWYKAFNIKKDDELYLKPESRVRIW